MKIRKFNVVELKNKNKATILDVKGRQYFAEIVNSFGETLDRTIITKDDISKVLYSKDRER